MREKSKPIVMDEDGNIRDYLAERNEEIKAELQEVLAEFIRERDAMMAMKRPPKLGYRFAKQMFLVLARYGQMSPDEFVRLTYEEIEDLWLNYQELTAYYNRYFDITDNKQLFCVFARINARQYSALENHADEDIRELMNAINSTFIGLGFVAAESGNADVKGVTQRLKSSGEAGHSVISAVEQSVIATVTAPTPAEMTRRLKNIPGLNLIEDNK